MSIDYAEVGRRIAKRRKELGLKQYELCELIDVNYKYVSNLETGRSAPSLETIMNLCEALRTTPDHLLTGAGTAGQSVTDEQLIEKIKRLPANAKASLNDIIDMILKA